MWIQSSLQLFCFVSYLCITYLLNWFWLEPQPLVDKLVNQQKKGNNFEYQSMVLSHF